MPHLRASGETSPRTKHEWSRDELLKQERGYPLGQEYGDQIRAETIRRAAKTSTAPRESFVQVTKLSPPSRASTGPCSTSLFAKFSDLQPSPFRGAPLWFAPADQPPSYATCSEISRGRLHGCFWHRHPGCRRSSDQIRKPRGKIPARADLRGAVTAAEALCDGADLAPAASLPVRSTTDTASPSSFMRNRTDPGETNDAECGRPRRLRALIDLRHTMEGGARNGALLFDRRPTCQCTVAAGRWF